MGNIKEFLDEYKSLSVATLGKLDELMVKHSIPQDAVHIVSLLQLSIDLDKIPTTKSVSGVSGSKSNGQILTEHHESILIKLGTEYPIRTTEIGGDILAYLKFLRKMRPNDKSISFIDEMLDIPLPNPVK